MAEDNDYVAIRKAIVEKKYELIYDYLMKELVNIKKTGITVNDLESLKVYVTNKTRKLVFDDTGIPTFIIKIILLLGEDYENGIKEKLGSYISTIYSSKFLSFVEKNFKGLPSIQLLYSQLDSLVKEFTNKYFNLPEEWNILSEVIKTNYFLMKQKICDVFYFENIPKDDYVQAFDIVMIDDKKFYKYIMVEQATFVEKESDSMVNIDEQNVYMIFRLFIPYINIYFEKTFKELNNNNFDIKESEMKIFSVFLSTFRIFERLYKKLNNNREAFLSLIKYLLCFLTNLIEKCNKECTLQYELLGDNTNENNFNSQNKLELIMVILNSTAYIYEYINGFGEVLTSHKEQLEQYTVLNNTLSALEKEFTQTLSLFISDLFKGIDFNTTGFSKKVIAIVEEVLFKINIEELFSDARRTLIECMVIYFLSRLYLLDFTVDKAEVYLCEIAVIKISLLKFNESLPLFSLLERYIKIFLCPTDDPTTFIDNFDLFSDGIFSFKQILNSLSDTSFIEKVAREYYCRFEPVEDIKRTTTGVEYNLIDQLNQMKYF